MSRSPSLAPSIIATFVVAAIVVLACLGGCDSPKDFATAPVHNERGQTITFVTEDKLHGWITEHKNLRLIALTGYAYGKGTDGYVIVYETPVEAPR